MVEAAVAFLVTTVAFGSVGTVTQKIFGWRNSGSGAFGTQSLGMVTLVTLSALLALGSFAHPATIVSALVSVAFVLTLSWYFRRPVSDRKLGTIAKPLARPTWYGAVVGAFGYLLLSSSLSTTPTIAWRVGPDNFGWLGSSAFMCRDADLNGLRTRIENVLPSGDFADAIIRPPLNQGLYISQIPSVSDQVAGEFLLGGDRLGLPALVGAFCQFQGGKFLLPFFLALGMWAVAISIVGLAQFSEARGVKPLQSLGLALAGVASFSVLSVSLEGGYGQLLSLPLFIGAVSQAVSKGPLSPPSLAWVALSVAFAMATYVDFLLFLGPIIFTLWLLLPGRFLTLERIKRMRVPNWGLVIFASLTLALVPGAVSQVSGRFASGGAGGFSQAGIPMPQNVLGLWNWLPDYAPGENVGRVFSLTDFQSVAEIGLGVVVVSLIAIFGWRASSLLLAALVLYSLLAGLVYFPELMRTGAPWLGNNYPIWKSGIYLSILMSMQFAAYLALASSQSSGASPLKKTRQHLSRVAKVAIPALLAIQIWSSGEWISGWHQNRNVSPDVSQDEVASVIADDYDLISFFEPWYVWSILPDLRYGSTTRGFGLPTMRSPDPRELAVVVGLDYEPSVTELTESTGLAVVGFEALVSTNRYQVFKIEIGPTE